MITLAFLGPAVGRHEGWVTTQGEVLAGLFAAEGHRVLLSSSRLNPIRRAADHAVDLLRWRRTADVVIVSVFSGKAFALADESLTLARALGLPSVAWLHGGNLPDFAAAHPRWMGRVLRRPDAVVAPTAYLARCADTLTTGIRIIPNVIDLSASQFRVRSPLQPRLLWMRTFQAVYDPATAVRTLAALRSTGIEATLTMAGQDKGLLDGTRALTHQLGVAGAVTFPGFVAGVKKAALLDGHDIFLNTNVVDNAPVTVLEAAASGLPVVSTNVGGIPDLLEDGTSARLVPPGDSSAMADAVRALLDDPDAAHRLTVAARVVAERSAWPVVRDQWSDLINTIDLSRRRRGG